MRNPLCPDKKCSFDAVMKWLFRNLGRTIGEHPFNFLIVPILLTALAATGFQRVNHEADPEYLFLPSNGEAKVERAALEEHFQMNYSDFDPGRMSRNGRFGRILITARDNGSILRDDLFREIVAVDAIVRNITFEWEGASLTYREICATRQGQCWKNDVLMLAPSMTAIEDGEEFLTYPIWFDPWNFDRIAFPFFTGGIELAEDHTISSIYVVSLNYFLDSGDENLLERGKVWEDAFLKTVGALETEFIDVAMFSSLTLEIELEDNTNSVIPYFGLNIGIMVVFCIITCMMRDNVRSKPLLGLVGVVSAIFGSISAFGFVMYCGVPFIGINLAAPFLMLGIGIDDTFVMLGSWRRTKIQSEVKDRMAKCYEEAGVSITITSITDMLSFFVGVITPFPCVQIFCIYTGAAVAFTYLWHITFFGACMAVAGYAEKSNRHALTCMKVKPKSESQKSGFFYQIFCSGGISKTDPHNPTDNSENGIMVFFRDYLGVALNLKPVKALVLFLFAVYLAFAIWGITQLKEGLERKRLARFDSYSTKFYYLEDTYFRDYPYRVSVLINGALDYSDPEIQADIENVMQKLENTTFIDPAYSESWLRDFLDFVKRNKGYQDIDISNEQAFIDNLEQTYLTEGSQFNNDVKLVAGANGTRHIVAARFLIQGAYIANAVEEKVFLEELRHVTHASKYNITVFHPYFMYFDQFLMVLPTTITCVTVAAVAMMIVSLIFIPSTVCSLWVAFSILSIEIGVVGFMTMWGVSLDSISMINLIMCIGFSVDFSVHISYHFMSKSHLTPDERVRDSLYALGLPILQGAVSTILGVIGLIIAPSYIFITFFKMVFLVIVLGALHGIFLLPVLLSIFGPPPPNSSTSFDPGSSAPNPVAVEMQTANGPTVIVRINNNQNAIPQQSNPDQKKYVSRTKL